MKFPYIPISYAIADVRAEFKRKDLMGEINDEDCINYAIETLREIGGANYPDDFTILHLRNNIAQLPANFYIVDEAWIVEDNPIFNHDTIWFTKEQRPYYRRQQLFPGDATTGTKYSRYNRTCESLAAPTYIIRHPNQFRCSLPTVTIGVKYVATPMTENGEHLMQDEINTIKAVKAYIKKMLLSEEYYAGHVSQNIWNDIKSDYETGVNMAQAIFKFSDPADDQARGHDQDHRYDAFKLQ